MLAAATGPSLDQIPPQKRLARNHMFHVYVLTSATIRHRYVGFSENLDDRFRRHNAGESNPRHGAPWILLHTERFQGEAKQWHGSGIRKRGGRDELDRLHVTVVGRQ